MRYNCVADWIGGRRSEDDRRLVILEEVTGITSASLGLPEAVVWIEVEAVVWPWINVVLFDALPLLVACCLVVPLAVSARRFRRSASVIVGGTSDTDPMSMTRTSLRTVEEPRPRFSPRSSGSAR